MQRVTSASLEELGQEVRRALEAQITQLPRGRLVDAMTYALLGGGKRLRPLLCLAACMDAGGTRGRALSPACAVEMMHCYSLAHDDLPCMDDDDERRGRPSLHKAFDEATALLAGDALQTLGFRMLTDCADISANDRLRMVRELADASGAAGMAGGQMLDLCPAVGDTHRTGTHTAVGDTHRLEHRRDTHRTGTHTAVGDTHRLEHHKQHLRDTQTHKTGALIRCALRLGLISAGQPSTLLDAFAEDFGLAFQAADDLADRLSPRETLGRPPGSDQKSNKLTWVNLIGIDETRSLCNELRESCLQKLNHSGCEPVLLRQVVLMALGK